MKNLSRLLKPQSIALIGGIWAKNVYTQLIKANFCGDIWPIHPSKANFGTHKCFRDISLLPNAPDATFVGVNKIKTIEIVKKLAEVGAGGAVCFASGFSETSQASSGFEGQDLQEQLVNESGDLAVLGPNCYGFINYLDGIMMWPDQHGGSRVASGVAIITQSSNIALNLTMQRRSLPIAYVLTVGNQAKIGMAELIEALIQDSRVTAIGLYIEGFGNLKAFEIAATKALHSKKPIVILKVGRTKKSVLSSISHTGSVAGSQETSSAFLSRMNCLEVYSLSSFLETLKIFHFCGHLKGPNVASVSCSGGEASLIADQSAGTDICFSDFNKVTKKKLIGILGPNVQISNPLDYHTFIWGETDLMIKTFIAVVKNPFDLIIFLLDVPRSDLCDDSSFQCAIEAIIATSKSTKKRLAVVSSIPESMPEALSKRFIKSGVLPLCGFDDAIIAIQNSISLGRIYRKKLTLSPPSVHFIAKATQKKDILIDEKTSKNALAAYDLKVPKSIEARSLTEALNLVCAKSLRYPLVVKALNFAHKTELGLVKTGITGKTELRDALDQILLKANSVIVEEMVTDNVIELSIGVIHDDVGIFRLSIGAGGIFTELFRSRVHMILPADNTEITNAIDQLDIAPILQGYRNQPAVKKEHVVDAINSIMAYVKDHLAIISEIEINPLIVGIKEAVAADILLIHHNSKETK